MALQLFERKVIKESARQNAAVKRGVRNYLIRRQLAQGRVEDAVKTVKIFPSQSTVTKKQADALGRHSQKLKQAIEEIKNLSEIQEMKTWFDEMVKWPEPENHLLHSPEHVEMLEELGKQQRRKPGNRTVTAIVALSEEPSWNERYRGEMTSNEHRHAEMQTKINAILEKNRIVGEDAESLLSLIHHPDFYVQVCKTNELLEKAAQQTQASELLSLAQQSLAKSDVATAIRILSHAVKTNPSRAKGLEMQLNAIVRNQVKIMRAIEQLDFEKPDCDKQNHIYEQLTAQGMQREDALVLTRLLDDNNFYTTLAKRIRY